jgi:hypothetical protein
MNYMIVIRCPNAQEDVPTGVVVDIGTFAGLPKGQATLLCPACRDTHIWSVADAMLACSRGEEAFDRTRPQRESPNSA